MQQLPFPYKVHLNFQSLQFLDVPFINGEFNTKGAFMNMNVDDIECDESMIVSKMIK